MSNALQVITGDIYAIEENFNRVLVDQSLNFQREAGFAIQILQVSDYALNIAMNNRQSVVDAVTNVAAIGISLNPAKKQAYLVPRDKKICLDISYMGLLDLAVASGSVRWAKAELVKTSDTFELNGFDKLPTHKFNPFDKNRGDNVGVYVVVKTNDGDYLTDTMTIDEVHAIRNRSSAWKAFVEKQKKCPWVTDEGEMIKKTIIKRAYKTWPRTDRLAQAVHHLNTDGGEGIELSGQIALPAPPKGFDLNGFLTRVKAATETDELKTIRREANAAAILANDVNSFNLFKAAFVERSAEILQQQGVTA